MESIFIYILVGVACFLIGKSWQNYKIKQEALKKIEQERVRIETEKLNVERERLAIIKKQEQEKEAEKQRQLQEIEQRKLMKTKSWWNGLSQIWKFQIKHNQSHNFHRQIDINNLKDSDLMNIAKMDNIYLDSIFIGSINGDLTPLGLFEDIYRLKAEGNNISDITILSKLPNLNRLYLDENNISDLSPLRNLEKLEMILLHNNLVQDLSPLDNLQNLECLILYNNRVTDLSPLKNLTNLAGLGISNNQIRTLQPIWHLDIGALDCSNTLIPHDEIERYFVEHPNCKDGINDPRYVSKKNPTGG